MRISDWSSDVCSSDLAINVDVDTPVDRFIRYLVQRFRIVDDTSIIHDDVKSAEHAPDLVCSAVHRLAVGYVNEQGHDVRAICLTLRRGGFECGGIYVDHDDCHAPLYERTGDPMPDARCGTCDDSDSVPEIFHHPLHVPELTEGQGAVADATTLPIMCS